MDNELFTYDSYYELDQWELDMEELARSIDDEWEIEAWEEQFYLSYEW